MKPLLNLAVRMALVCCVLFVPSLDAVAQCINLTGSYFVQVNGTITYHLDGYPDDTDPISASDTIYISQSGCNFSYVLEDPTGSGNNIVVSGTVNGLAVRITSLAAVPQPGVQVTKNEFVGTGTVRNGGIDINGNGIITGTFQGRSFRITTSVRAVLSNYFLTAPQVISAPANRSVLDGASTAFTVSVSGASPLSYQWRLNGVNIPGATDSTYTISSVQPAHGGSYSVLLSNPLGSSSASASLTVRHILTASWTGSGSLSPGGLFQVNSGASQTFTAVPGANQTVGEWYVNGARVKTGGTTFTLSNIRARKSVQVVFRPIIKLFLQQTNGSQIEWRLNGTNFLSNFLLPPVLSSWQAVDQHDFNYDGKVDFLYRNSNRQILLRTMDGSSVLRQNLAAAGNSAPDGWMLSALADLGGTAQLDFVFQTSSNRLMGWVMGAGTNLVSTVLLPMHNVGWRVVGTADFNDDQKPDILWQDPSGRVAVWFMNGPTRLGVAWLRNNQPVALNANICALVDFDHNGQNDIVLQNNLGQVSVWLMNRTNYLGSALLLNGRALTPGWRVIGPK